MLKRPATIFYVAPRWLLWLTPILPTILAKFLVKRVGGLVVVKEEDSPACQVEVPHLGDC